MATIHPHIHFLTAYPLQGHRVGGSLTQVSTTFQGFLYVVNLPGTCVCVCFFFNLTIIVLYDF